MLSVRALTQVFDGIPILNGVSFDLKAGESLSLRGESGCGKTTLMNILGGLQQPSSGAVFWEGRRLDSLSPGELARLRGRDFGFVFQNPTLVAELNLLENCLLAARIQGSLDAVVKRRVLELLEQVGLQQHTRALVHTLSGGQRQRAALVRALSLKPKLLLADEPTGNLDEQTAKVVMDLLMQLCQAQGTALMLVTHHAAFAQRTRHQATLSLGKWIS